MQTIRPRDVNWMTAGRGIVHSERESQERRTQARRTHGIQSWVALPLGEEEGAPSFFHHAAASLPSLVLEGARVTVVVGQAWGVRSPVRTASRLYYVEAHVDAGASLPFDSDGQEAAIYLLSGRITVEAATTRERFEAPVMVVLRTGARVTIVAQSDAHAMLLGGDPLDGERHIFWNFVSSSPARIEEAKAAWRDQRHPFGPIAGETEWVPLPE